jgi:hypothetical protein
VGSDHTDLSYRDVADVTLAKGFLRSTVEIKPRFGLPLALGALPNSDAERAYGLIRENLERTKGPATTPGGHSQAAR